MDEDRVEGNGVEVDEDGVEDEVEDEEEEEMRDKT